MRNFISKNESYKIQSNNFNQAGRFFNNAKRTQSQVLMIIYPNAPNTKNANIFPPL